MIDISVQWQYMIVRLYYMIMCTLIPFSLHEINSFHYPSNSLYYLVILSALWPNNIFWPLYIQYNVPSIPGIVILWYRYWSIFPIYYEWEWESKYQVHRELLILIWHIIWKVTFLGTYPISNHFWNKMVWNSLLAVLFISLLVWVGGWLDGWVGGGLIKVKTKLSPELVFS